MSSSRVSSRGVVLQNGSMLERQRNNQPRCVWHLQGHQKRLLRTETYLSLSLSLCWTLEKILPIAALAFSCKWAQCAVRWGFKVGLGKSCSCSRDQTGALEHWSVHQS